MVAAFDYCLHGRGGAAPSIDTAMHGLVDAPHVDHLHPDSGIAIATAADGERLTRQIFGDKVVWVPWRRPGFQLGLDIAAIKAGQPEGDRLRPRRPRDHGVGRHLREVRTQLPVDDPDRRALHQEALQEEPVRSTREEVRAAGAAPSDAARGGHSRHCCGASPHRTSRWWATSPMTRSCSTSWRRATILGSGRARDELPRPLPAHQGEAPGGRPAAGRSLEQGHRPGGRAPRGVPGRLPGLLRPARDHGLTRDPRRSDPLVVLVPGVGMFSYGRTSRPLGWPASST